MARCPACGETSFEMRGMRRVYAPLTDDLEVDGWNYGDDIDWDVTEDGAAEEIIYCVGCDSMFARPELEAT